MQAVRVFQSQILYCPFHNHKFSSVITTGCIISFHPGPEGSGYIARLLKENFYITELDLAQNKIKRPGAQAVAEALSDNSTIKKLNLSWNDFKDKDAECLAEGIRVNETLTWLDLSHNGFAEEAGMLFGEHINLDAKVSF